MSHLLSLIQLLEKQIENHQAENLNVSKSNIGWHIDHSLLVINGIINQLKKSNPELYRKQFNWKRFYIQLRGKIPRGKGKAPKVVQPTEATSVEKLMTQLDNAKKNVFELEHLSPNNYFSHPYFGDLNLKSTIWFLKLHTNHHLKIINDIINKS